MRKLRIDGNFWLALLLNMLFHLEGTIPAWAAKCGNTPDPPKKNVNPYSVRSSQKQDEE